MISTLASNFARLTQLRDWRAARYLAASVGALAVDVAVFLAMMGQGVADVLASAFGYIFGIVAHWILSSRAVFAEGVAAHGEGRGRQKVLFVISALVGLGLTMGIVGIGSALGIDPRLAKLVAVGVSFVATYLLRAHVVFRGGAVQ